MKVVFMGTPDFAVPPLDALVKNGHEVVLCVTQPDKPKGRSQVLTPPPVKEYAVSRNIPVFQPQKVKTEETLSYLKGFDADIFIVVAYGKILPKSILDLPKYGCVNIHASLLPKLRGAAPIQWSIANGETVTGVTSMQMDVGLDTGDMLIKKETPIFDEDNGESLHDRLSYLGAEVLISTLDAIENGTISPEKQDDALSNYAPMITKENTKIDFTKSAKSVFNLIRAMNPYPAAYTTYNGKKLKILSSVVVDKKPEANCGVVESVLDDSFLIACSDGLLKVLELQIEGKKRMAAADFLKGNKISVGDMLV